MSIITSPLLLGGTDGYQISRSLRFNGADTAYLNRTPSVAGNRKKWTWAGWVKQTGNSSYNNTFYAVYLDSGNYTYFNFLTNGRINFYNYVGSTDRGQLGTTPVYRDFSAWYHIVFVWDSANATVGNRIKLYVNGLEVTTFAYYTDPSSADSSINSTNIHYIGYNTGGSYAGSSDFYLADVHFIDGQALTPSSFTTTDLTTGQLIPKAYTGTYGTNGFKLNFSNNSTVAALGTDSSGNGNTFTVNNLSVTPGVGNDSFVDTPTSYGNDTGVGGEVRGNYATLNPLNKTFYSTLSDGNLFITDNTSNGSGSNFATIGMSTGKWYWEQTLTVVYSSERQLGIGNKDTPLNNFPGSSAGSYGFDANNNKYNSNSATAYTTSWVSGDVIGIAFDADAGSLTLYKNGVSLGVAFSSIPADTYFPLVGSYYVGQNYLNFGQRAFAYTAPAGFKALCDTNLPTPSIAKPNTVMDTVLYTGTGAVQNITGLAFSPDLVWIKSRSASVNHELTDSVRGVTKSLNSNTTSTETTDVNGLTAFNSNGFSLGTDTNYNNSTFTYVAWTWDAGSSTVTNTAGSSTSQVRANPSSGFSVVTYTGTSANATVGHGLNVAPGMVIVKRLTSTTSNWNVRHASIVASGTIQLNLTSSAFSSPTTWNSTAPTSTVFSVGTNTEVNANTDSYVAYCFSPVAGYSSFGSYSGNGSSNGPFVYLGFRPAVVIIRRSNSTGSWVILDDKREGYNVDNDDLYANLASSENATDLIDILSNGFKLRSSDTNVNSGNLIYAAWAATPFQYSRAR
jgi:hypothetical protein